MWTIITHVNGWYCKQRTRLYTYSYSALGQMIKCNSCCDYYCTTKVIITIITDARAVDFMFRTIRRVLPKDGSKIA